MSMPRDEQGQPEVNPDDENADLGSDGSGEVDLDPDEDSEADYEPQPAADIEPDPENLTDAENRVKAGNTGAESTGPNEPASAADADSEH
ncbi:hypothetical protein [Citricoccus muralis]|uniref:Uncharacterized protein n=1 Tax=Citricoccus muralis TaxID=169134 RepID=A0A3D9LBH3_9MICC|nr:hypothetical protein [Citricoccus muralis]REE03729.1 hypothetical protein C8E99_1546 [Citricoccus muralis]